MSTPGVPLPTVSRGERERGEHSDSHLLDFPLVPQPPGAKDCGASRWPDSPPTHTTLLGVPTDLLVKWGVAHALLSVTEVRLHSGSCCEAQTPHSCWVCGTHQVSVNFASSPFPPAPPPCTYRPEEHIWLPVNRWGWGAPHCAVPIPRWVTEPNKRRLSPQGSFFPLLVSVLWAQHWVPYQNISFKCTLYFLTTFTLFLPLPPSALMVYLCR